MNQQKHENFTGKPSPWRPLATSLVCGLGIFLFFRQFFLTGGRMIVGDLGDGRLIMCIHEHWYRFLMGKEGFFDLGIYYPETNVLGYSDTFLMGGLIHSLFRFVGFDVFLSFQIVQIATGVAGFYGILTWLHRYRGISYGTSLYGALLLIIVSPVFISTRNSHIQMLSIWWIPWVIILMEQCWRDALTNPSRLYRSFTGLCALYSTLAYSTFYVAWFFLLFTIIWILTAIPILGLKNILNTLRLRMPSLPFLIPGLVVLALVGTLFLSTYLPVRSTFGGRTMSLILELMPSLWDLLNHSEYNLLWGKVAPLFPDYVHSLKFEHEVSITPLLLLIFLMTSFALLLRWRSRDLVFEKTTVLSILFSLLLLVKIGGLTFWILPYYLVPGADAVRVIQRYIVLLTLPMVFVCCFGFDRLARGLSSPVRVSLLSLIGGLILAEQIQLTSNANIDRIEQTEILRNSPPPPHDATAFRVMGMFGWDGEAERLQNDAFLFSQYWDLPTVNGRSGFAPPHWSLWYPKLTEGDIYLRNWAFASGLEGVVYDFDVDKSAWGESISFIRPSLPNLPLPIDLLKPDTFSSIAGPGWNLPESWGVWNNGTVSILRFMPLEMSQRPLVLQMEINTLLHPEHPEQTLVILLGRKEIFRTTFTFESPQQSFSFEIPERAIRKGFKLTFKTKNAFSPRQMGLSEDTRVLGIGLKQLRLTHDVHSK